MGQFTPYADVTLTLKENNGNLVNISLDNAWTVIEHKDTIPQSLVITLSASFGTFLSRGPKIKNQDKIFFKWTDARGNSDSDVFLVNNFQRSRKSSRGKKLKLKCVHESHYLWKRTISLTSKRVSSHTVLNEIVSILNDSENSGSKDPVIETVEPFNIVSKTGNNLSKTNTNDYIFEAKKLERVFEQISDIEAQPPEGGGSFQPPYIRFKSKYNGTNEADLGKIFIQAYAQGFNKNNNSEEFSNIPNATLLHNSDPNSTDTNIFSNDSNEIPEQGTNLELRCNKSSGDYLGDFTKFQGAKRVFNSVRSWGAGINYRVGNLVLNSDGLTFDCIINHTSDGTNEPANALFWIQRSFTKPLPWAIGNIFTIHSLTLHNKIAYKSLQTHTATANDEPGLDDTFWIRVFFVPTTDYSPATKQKAQYWINGLAGAKYANQDIDRTKIMSPNIIVEDTLHPRTYVRWVGTDPANIPTELLVDGKVPHAFKVLAINPTDGVPGGSGDFSGNDKNNIPFAGNVTQYIDPNFDGTGEWEVFLGKPTTTQDHEIVDWFECLSWVKNPCEGILSFVDGNGVCQFGTRGTTWKKGAYVFQSIIPGQPSGHFQDNRQFECLHSIDFDDLAGHINVGNKEGIEDDTDGNSAVFIKTTPDITPSAEELDDFDRFVGFNFWSLFPVSSNAIPYGSVTTGELIKLPVFDFNNLDKNSDGGREWFGPKHEEFYPINALAFFLQLNTVRSFVGGVFTGFSDILTPGDYNFRVALIDARDNIRTIDFTQQREKSFLSQQPPLPGKNYKGVPGVAGFFSSQQPNPINAYDPKQFVLGIIYTSDSFDDQGKYKNNNRYANATELELVLDAYRMIKPLIITNVDEPNAKPDQNIETQPITNESVQSYSQGKALILGLEKILNFKRDEFTISSSGRADIKHGDPVYYTDPLMIDETTDALPNTVKCVVDNIIRTFSKSKNGAGGIVQDFGIITRLWPI